MEMPPAPIEPESLPHPPDVPDYRPVLNELLSLGTELSRIIVQRAAAEPPTPVADAATAFDRVTTGMRRTILLLRHLDEPARPSATQHRVTARKRILRDVEDAIDRATSHDRLRPLGEAEKADLRLELLERLDARDTEDEITGRPVEDIIRDICRDLDISDVSISHRGRRRTTADIAALNTRAATPPVTKPWGESGNPPPPARHRNDDTPELMSLNDIILRHVADASPGFPGHNTS